jgi:acetylserotonin N-methyltransferase
MQVGLSAGQAADSAAEALDRLPSVDLASLLERLGCKLITRDRSPLQYVAWAQKAGVFEALAAIGKAFGDELSAHTCLNGAGVDALLGVLCSLDLVTQDVGGRYALAPAGREYFLRASPFFIGDQLFAPRRGIPRQYTERHTSLKTRTASKLVLNLSPTLRFGTMKRLDNQHARNLSAGIAAVQAGDFRGVHCLVDLGGGSGTFSIPLALKYRDMRIVLAELPQALKNVRRRLAQQNLLERIELVAVNVFVRPWRIPDCEGIFIGNLLHAFGDDNCLMVCREAYERLPAGGKIWLHEMTWNAGRAGPLVTSLWNATMRLGSGKQRSVDELVGLLSEAGFVESHAVPTAAAFTLISATKR